MRNFRSFRITTKDELTFFAEEVLNLEGFFVKKLSFYDRARICLDKRLDIGNSLLNRFGHIYIQDLSSMLPPLMLAPKKGALVLDLCASPGGKGSILSELVGSYGIVVANEPVKKRYMTLKKNIERLNLFNVVTTCYKGEEFPETTLFDYVLLDVPCSGWGTADKNPTVLKLWQGNRLEPLIKLQRRLLKKGFSLLKPGGKLIYSTCTTNFAENQQQIMWALKEFSFDLIPLHPVDGFSYDPENPMPETLAIRGHRYYSQGFFIACLEKKETIPSSTTSFSKLNSHKQFINQCMIFDYLTDLGLDCSEISHGLFYRVNENVFYLPMVFENLISEGLFIGRLKKDRFIPSLNLWKLMNKNMKNVIQVDDINEIKRLLNGESLNVSSNNKYLQLFFKDLPLCLVSVKNGRCLITR